MKISIIVAIDEKNGIGKNGQMPWHISEDFKRFKQITLNHTVIMGRKTWESLPLKPLPDRYNIVITKDLNFNDPKLGNAGQIAYSLEAGIDIAKKQQGADEIFIIGGGQIFQQAMPLVNKLYITKVKGDYNADTFFPDYSSFNVVSQEDHESADYKFKFLVLEK